MNEEKPVPKWQPVLLIANRQLTCVCGNLAIFVTVSIVEDEACIKLEKVDC